MHVDCSELGVVCAWTGASKGGPASRAYGMKQKGAAKKARPSTQMTPAGVRVSHCSRRCAKLELSVSVCRVRQHPLQTCSPHNSQPLVDMSRIR